MVVFPSWLPFFLQNPTKDNAAHAKTQDATQYAATKDAKNTQRTQKARTLSKILLLSPKSPPNGFHLLTE